MTKKQKQEQPGDQGEPAVVAPAPPPTPAFALGQAVRIKTSHREGKIGLILGGGWYNVIIGLPGRGITQDVLEKNLEDASAPSQEQLQQQQREAEEHARAQRMAVQAKVLDEMAAPAERELAKVRDEELLLLEEELTEDKIDADDLVARQRRQQIQGRYDDGVKAVREKLLASDEYQARIAT